MQCVTASDNRLRHGLEQCRKHLPAARRIAVCTHNSRSNGCQLGADLGDEQRQSPYSLPILEAARLFADDRRLTNSGKQTRKKGAEQEADENRGNCRHKSRQHEAVIEQVFADFRRAGLVKRNRR